MRDLRTLFGFWKPFKEWFLERFVLNYDDSPAGPCEVWGDDAGFHPVVAQWAGMGVIAEDLPCLPMRERRLDVDLLLKGDDWQGEAAPVEGRSLAEFRLEGAEVERLVVLGCRGLRRCLHLLDPYENVYNLLLKELLDPAFGLHGVSVEMERPVVLDRASMGRVDFVLQDRYGKWLAMAECLIYRRSDYYGVGGHLRRLFAYNGGVQRDLFLIVFPGPGARLDWAGYQRGMQLYVDRLNGFFAEPAVCEDGVWIGRSVHGELTVRHVVVGDRCAALR